MPSSEDKDEDEAFSSVELDRERAETLRSTLSLTLMRARFTRPSGS